MITGHGVQLRSSPSGRVRPSLEPADHTSSMQAQRYEVSVITVEL